MFWILNNTDHKILSVCSPLNTSLPIYQSKTIFILVERVLFFRIYNYFLCGLFGDVVCSDFLIWKPHIRLINFCIRYYLYYGSSSRWTIKINKRNFRLLKFSVLSKGHFIQPVVRRTNASRMIKLNMNHLI